MKNDPGVSLEIFKVLRQKIGNKLFSIANIFLHTKQTLEEDYFFNIYLIVHIIVFFFQEEKHNFKN